jgi:hypothetical protein
MYGKKQGGQMPDGNAKVRMGNTLTRVATFLGGLGAVTMLLRLKLELTPSTRQVLFYPGLFAASAVLIILGAWYGRDGRREIAESRKLDELTSGSENQLGHSAGSIDAPDALNEKR